MEMPVHRSPDRFYEESAVNFLEMIRTLAVQVDRVGRQVAEFPVQPGQQHQHSGRGNWPYTGN
jgi:hypothetical protein